MPPKKGLIQKWKLKWTDISQKREYKWVTVHEKDAWHLWPLGKCKYSNPEILYYFIGDGYHRLKKIKIKREAKEMFLYCWWECKLIQPLWKMIWRFLKQIKIEILTDPTVPLLGIFLKIKDIIYIDACILMCMTA